MPLFRKKDSAPAPPSAVVAAALPLAGPAGKQAWAASTSDVAWQKQAWYFYDAVGELRFAFNWLAAALSRAALFAAETDPETGQTTGPTDDPRVQAAAEQVLGGPKNLPRILTLVALHWQVSGETYILIIPQGRNEPDRWEALTRNSLREQGGTWSFKDPLTGVWTKLGPNDRVIRIWQPHPDEQTHADCAMRAAIPICAEIEKSTQNIAARLDSRLMSNGLYLIPQEIEFPSKNGEPFSAQVFRNMLMEAMTASMANQGSAEAQAPIVAEVPGEWISAMADGHVDFSTAMDATVNDTREAAITRLGRTLELSREIAVGDMAAANHWTAWQIEETTYKIHLQPWLLRFGMSLTTEYFHQVLTQMGVQDPDRYLLNWDITEVVARPDNRDDLKWLWDQNLVSADYVLAEFGIPDDARPSDEEQRKQLARILVSGAPTLLENPSVAAELGFTPSVPQDAPGTTTTQAQADSVRALPDRTAQPEEGLVAAAEMIVYDALMRAGGRMLTPTYRGQFKDVQRYDLHTVIPVADPLKLMEGSFQFTDRVADGFGLDRTRFRQAVEGYVHVLLTERRAHRVADLRYVLGAIA